MILVGLWLIYLLSILLRLIHPSLCVISPKIHIINLRKPETRFVLITRGQNNNKR